MKTMIYPNLSGWFSGGDIYDTWPEMFLSFKDIFDREALLTRSLERLISSCSCSWKTFLNSTKQVDIDCTARRSAHAACPRNWWNSKLVHEICGNQCSVFTKLVDFTLFPESWWIFLAEDILLHQYFFILTF